MKTKCLLNQKNLLIIGLSLFSSLCHAESIPEPSSHWTMDRVDGSVLPDESGYRPALVPELSGGKDRLTGEILPDFTPEFAVGINGQALKLDAGQQGYVTLSGSGSFSFANGLTLSVWVQPAQRSARMSILSCAEDRPDPAGGFNLLHQYGRIRLIAVDATGKAVALQSEAESIRAKEWTHVAAVVDRASLRLFLNGVQVAESDFQGPLRMADTPMVIGNHATIQGWRHAQCPAFGGLLDELKIWEQALNEQEIQAVADEAF